MSFFVLFFFYAQAWLDKSICRSKMRSILKGSKYFDSASHINYNSYKLLFLSNEKLGTIFSQPEKDPIAFAHKEVA